MKPVLREWLTVMEKDGLIKHIKRRVDPVFELAALGKKLSPRYGAYFEKAGDSAVPVITGLTNSRELMAKALGCTYDQLLKKYSEGLNKVVPCEILDKSKGPFAVKKNIIRGADVDIFRQLPACVHHEKDNGKYLTAALCVAKDPETGIRNVAIHRHQLSDRNHLGALLLPRHTMQMYNKAEALGRPLEIALVIGVHPALLLASQATTQFGIDELEIAGALLGEAVQLVKCETIDVEVPVESEFVIEGKILPNVRKDEGPFGEYPRTYGAKAPRHFIEITAITHRDNPLYHTIIPASMEHLLIGAISREVTMLQMLRQTSPNVTGVHLTPSGGCRYHAVVQITPKNRGEAKNVLFAAMASSSEVKHAVAVNTDIDIFDSGDVEWAIANRVQASRDVFIVAEAMGNNLDPSAKDGVSDKMGIDATIPLDRDPARFEKIVIPGFENLDIDDYL